jgi:hypothetical protein
MSRNIDVMTEMRKLTGSKPVQAVAGAGALASQTLKDLPGLLARWRKEAPMTSLPSRATGYAQKAQARATGYAQTAQSRATEYVQKARAMATGGYDQLAARGKKALNGQSHATSAIGTPAAQGKMAATGKIKGKAPSASSGTTSTSH